MAFLPMWIIGAPLVIAIFDWMRTPKGSRHERVAPLDPYPAR